MPHPFFLQFRLLFSVSCFHRADASASTAINALVGIDLVLAVAFSDSFLRAFAGASAAADALIIDYICHSSSSFEANYIYNSRNITYFWGYYK